MPESSPPSLWTNILAGIAAFILGSGLLGYLKFWREWRHEPEEREVSGAQADLHRASADEVRARTLRDEEDELWQRLRLEMVDMRTDVARLRTERDTADDRVGALLIERRGLRDRVTALEDEVSVKSAAIRSLENQNEAFNARHQCDQAEIEKLKGQHDMDIPT
jgi:chromosome segregation ATPase